MTSPIEQAVAKIGGQLATARALTAAGMPVTPSLISQWVTGRRPLPPKYCPELERLTGIRCDELLPEIVWTRDTGGVITGYHVPLRAAS